MSGRFRSTGRTLPVFLLLMTFPFLVYAQATLGSKHFPDDDLVTCPSAANVHNNPLPSGDWANATWWLNYDGSNYALTWYCVTGAPTFPYEPVGTATGPGGCPGGTAAVTGVREIACQTGLAVQTRTAKAFCYNALGFKGKSVQLNLGPPAAPVACPATAADCAAITDTSFSLPSHFVRIRNSCDNNACGFDISPAPGGSDRGLDFKRAPGANACSFGAISFSGGASPQTVSTDMLNFYFFQAKPAVSGGTLTIKLWRRGNFSSTPDDIRPPISLITNLTLLHNNIVDSLNSSPVGIHAGFLPNPHNARHSHFQNEQGEPNIPPPFDFSTPIVEINNAYAQLQQVQVSISNNTQVQIFTSTENSPLQPVPTLNPWGVTVLILALLLSTTWLIRRRHLKRA